MARILIRKEQRQVERYIEDLGNGIGLDMIKIPGGTFQMGSPEDELERLDREGPQHEVTVPEFYFGRYPITQGQWKAVVETTEKVNQDLKEEPSYFKDAYEEYDHWSRPVERVSWSDAKEFCDRLTQKTGREYRLPSEAEWEYACRAGTTTPFHFGETITTDLANYNGTDEEYGSYGRGPKGEYRQQTTPVGYFKAANPFGLYDMHGNVWEWCEDDYHNNYENAPTDGQARLVDELAYKVIRGGSWLSNPRYCRSACRYGNGPVNGHVNVGIRVVRVSPRILQ
ncbi:MAG: formylglycine-generating enzyme family protein [Microcoleaceae cyanobacterium]